MTSAAAPRRARVPLTPVQQDLRQLAATYHLGAVCNAINSVGVRRGRDRLPWTAYLAALVLRRLLDELGLSDPSGEAHARLVADVWRAP